MTKVIFVLKSKKTNKWTVKYDNLKHHTVDYFYKKNKYSIIIKIYKIAEPPIFYKIKDHFNENNLSDALYQVLSNKNLIDKITNYCNYKDINYLSNVDSDKYYNDTNYEIKFNKKSNLAINLLKLFGC